jgi:hypothetical protein
MRRIDFDGIRYALTFGLLMLPFAVSSQTTMPEMLIKGSETVRLYSRINQDL